MNYEHDNLKCWHNNKQTLINVYQIIRTEKKIKN